MLEPYRMVLVNCVALFSFVFGVTFYKYIYPKKNLSYLTLIILISILPLISLLRIGVYESGDFAINVIKTISLYESLSSNIFPVHWAGSLNATYGYPLFIFTYPLPYYLMAFFHFAGFSFIASHKIALALPYLLSGVGMYLFLKKYTRPFAAFSGAVIYQFAPYHLVDLHFRVALGETYSFAFIPLLFYFLKRFFDEKKLYLFLLSVIAYSLLILSHQAISLIVSPIVILFILLESKNKKEIFTGLTVIFWGLLMSAFYWLPVIFEKQFTYQTLYSKQVSFEPIQMYLFSPWRYGFLYQGPKGELSYAIGYIQLIILVLAVFLLTRSFYKKNLMKYVFFCLFVLLILFFLLTPNSIDLWNLIPLINNFQFSYRLLVPISFLLAFLASLIFTHVKNTKVVIAIAFFAIFISILNWGNRTMLTDISDSYLVSRVPYSTWEGEGLQPAAPRWSNTPELPWFKTPPIAHIQFVWGSGVIKEIKRTPNQHIYSIHSSDIAAIRENTTYFPGWNLYINKTKKKIIIAKDGTLLFALPSGNNIVELRFENTPVRTYSQNLSLVAFSIFILSAFYALILQRRR